MVALGTHAPMDDEVLAKLALDGGLPVSNHEWWVEETFADVGTLSREEVTRLSAGRLDEAVNIRVNRAVLEHDVTVIIGPVLPHEVVGFSGGNKYLFPGLSGQEFIDFTHWLGALITSAEIIGTVGTTPVRALIDAAAGLVPGERYALSVVVDPSSDEIDAAAFGEPKESWALASEVAARTHVVYLPRPVRRVISLISPRYPDLWTGAKGFYKVEPVVADGGEVILFAPHIDEVARMHPSLIDLGYHCRDYFLANWEAFQDVPRGELAHSTHLYGAGTYDLVRGESQRVQVTLATGIPKDIVETIGLAYLDPRTLDVDRARSDNGTLVVDDAGEVLYRLLPDTGIDLWVESTDSVEQGP